MKLKSIRWRLPLSYIAIALIASLVLGSVMLLVLHSHYVKLELEYLGANAQMLKPTIEQMLNAQTSDQILQNHVSGLGFISQTRIRILDGDGHTIADSGALETNQVVAVSTGDLPVDGFNSFSIINPLDSDPTNSSFFEDMAGPSEGDEGSGYLPTTILNLSATSLGGRIFADTADLAIQRRSKQVVSLELGDSLGVLEISEGPAYGSDILRAASIAWAIAGVVALALATWAGLYISKRMTRPVLVLTEATRHMERGKLDTRIELPREKQQEFVDLARAFNGMAMKVDNTISTLRTFVSDAAHELNTPLTALKTNLELAASEPDLVSREHFLTSAIEQNQRLEQLTGNLLDLSRIESVQSEVEPINLKKLTAEVGERFASRAEQAERIFILGLPNDEIPVRGNLIQLQRAISNLLENALKFTPSGGAISLELEREADKAKLTVSDNGIGVPPEDIPHMFERFHRGRNASGFPGNGLGLAIVKAVVDAHNGEISVESIPAGGTRFVINFWLDRIG